MKVRIYKAGGNTGRFISKLDKFLPTAAKGLEVEQMKQLKNAIKYQLDDKNKSENSVVLELVRGGYDYNYSKDLVESVANEIEEDYYSRKKGASKDESTMDSELIPDDEDTSEDEAETKDRLRRKMMSQNMQDDIAQTAEDTDDEDSDDEAYDEEVMNEPSPFEDELETAAFGREVSDNQITWPGMYNDLASMKKGGVPNKSKFIKSTVKKLKKAEKGMQKDPSVNQMPNPFGTINNPLGIDTTPNKALVGAIKNTAQDFVTEQRLKEQAEQMYNQQFMQPNQQQMMPYAEEGGANDWATNLHNYGESLSHSMPSMNTTGMNTNFNGEEMAFGGSSRRVRRANRAFFGLPIAPPGAKTDYEFGPLGGLKRGQVEWDMAGIGQALKDNPQLAGMLMPKIGMGMPSGKGIWNWWTGNTPTMNFGNVFGGGYGGSYGSSTSYGTPKTRLKWATETINNAADPAKNEEAGKLNNNSDQTDQKRKYQEYINWWASTPIEAGYSRSAPITIEEFTAKGEDGKSEYDYWVERTKASSALPSGTVSGSVSGSKSVNAPATVQNKPSNVSSNKPKSNPLKNKPVNKPKDEPKSEPTVTENKAAAINKANSPKVTPPAKKPTVKLSDDPLSFWNSQQVLDKLEKEGKYTPPPSTWDYIEQGIKVIKPEIGYVADKIGSWFGYEHGGFVDSSRPDLTKFIYGGDEYAYGGNVRRFDNGGANQIDPNYRDAGGRNYQDYIDWYGSNAVGEGMSRQAPQTWKEWKAEQDADKNPAGTGTGTNTGTGTGSGTGTGNTTYDQAYFQNMFKNDPAFKQGFETFMRSQTQGQGMGTGMQRQPGNFQWTNNQGTPLVGVGPTSRGFGSGIGNFFGFNKDFNAYYSPQGQITREMISQAMKNPANKVTETKFKDRGKWWNPFDTKRVTEWTINPATGQPAPAASTPGNTPANANAPKSQATNVPSVVTNTSGPRNDQSQNTGIDQTPEDWQYNQPAMDYMKQSLTLGNNAGAGTGAGASQNNTSTQGAGSQMSGSQPTGTNIPNTGVNEDIPKGMFLQTRQDGDYQAGIDRRGRLVSRGTAPQQQPTEEQRQMGQQIMNAMSGRTSPQPTQPIPTFNKQATGNYSDFNQSNMPNARIDGTAQPAPTQPTPAQPAPVQTPASGIPYNTAGPMNMMEEGMAYGGYVPAYMAYGGYMPDYGYGGYYPDGGSTVVGPNPDFAGSQQNDFAKDADGNGIPDYLEVKDAPAAGNEPFKYRLEEESAFSWDPKKTAVGINKTLGAATDVLQAGQFAKSRENENAKYMYAQDIDRQLTYKGLTDEQGIDKKAGFESGRTYIGQYGGAKYAKGGNTYTKGKVYSLTMDEINEIKRRGGSVKFIK